ncbi:Putative MetA-pathway of phenol degradation [Maribacter sedimenticola]|uniref:MetA-pathway of phenol degradation n=1 Tax=Maribacter sedimenticola TaxID=228956 RepID=A0ABY1SJM5_9FLAO|nr:transporter [Maribacter sedimenticola]SNR65345.1 Putative MetA-pathway of phenol degradation [Maribacter sedimenticola]
MNSLLAYSKPNYYIFAFLLLIPLYGLSQYTDVINSNRPGLSVSAYAVGKNVVQAEMGLFYEQKDHTLLNTQSDIWGTDIALRYGLLFEQLELSYEGTFQDQDLTYSNFNLLAKRRDFSRNRLGLKYLVYDPFKNPEANKPNLYSWRANHKFQFKNLLPAVSLYGGANFVFGDNPFYVGEPTISYRGMIATQSRLTPRFVLITNTAFDRITTDDPELSYLISLSHAFRNPKWSVFVEHQGIQSDRYADLLLRGGIAHLLKENLQLDFNMGASLKNTPTRIFFGFGGSYRMDFHKDSLKPIEDQEADQNGGAIDKNAMKKEKRKKRKGNGAEDIDLGPSKKQLKKLKKKEKKKQKESSEIDF